MGQKLILRKNCCQSGKFKLLGISFDLFATDKTALNFSQKIEKIKNLLNSWIYRDLTYMGRITVIKSLALPILIQVLTVLPNPPKMFSKKFKIYFSRSYGMENQIKSEERSL